MEPVNALIDAGPLVGYLDQSDQWHDFAVAVFRQVQFPAFTCEAVLSEAAYLLRGSARARAGLLEIVDVGALQVLPVFPDGRAYVRAVLSRYGERSNLADAGLLWLAESHPAATILTTDKRDFARYRLGTGRSPHLLAP